MGEDVSHIMLNTLAPTATSSSVYTDLYMMSLFLESRTLATNSPTSTTVANPFSSGYSSQLLNINNNLSPIQSHNVYMGDVSA